MKKIIITILFFILVNSGCIFADTYYMANNPCSGNPGWGNGSNSNPGTKDAPFLDFHYAISQMSAGDTLIVDDGTYTGNRNAISRYDNLPFGNNGPDGIDGTPDDVYTTIKAETDGNVFIDGEKIDIVGHEFVDWPADKVLSKPGSKACFMIWRGFVVRDENNIPIGIQNTKYVKLINCGATTGDKILGNARNIAVIHAKYILVEGCYTWGNVGYAYMEALHSDHVIWRNCVIRYDRCEFTNGGQGGGFYNYSCAFNEVQNGIVIDGDSGWQHMGHYSGFTGSFGNPATSPRYDEYGPNRYTNCIALNNTHRFGVADRGGRNFIYYKNCVGWDMTIHPCGPKGSEYSEEDKYKPSNIFSGQAESHFDNCTFGNTSTFSGADIWEDQGLFAAVNNSSMTNTIIHNVSKGKLLNFNPSSGYTSLLEHINISEFGPGYDLYFNSNSKRITEGTKLSYNYLESNRDLLKVSNSSPLATAGKNGKRVGAEIIYQFGKSGSMWGEPGYDKLQDGTNGQDRVKLWPFPNEKIMRDKMRTYSYSGETTDYNPETREFYDVLIPIDGKRGFCAQGETLTNYIWGYLNKQRKAKGEPLIPIPFFNVNTTPGDKKVTLSWEANTYDEDIVDYKVYAGTASGNYDIVNGKSAGNETSEIVTGLTNGTLYYFAVTAVNGDGKESSIIYEETAVPIPFSVIVSLSPGSFLKTGDILTISADFKTDNEVTGTPKISVAYSNSNQPEADMVFKESKTWEHMITVPSGNEGQARITIKAEDSVGNILEDSTNTFTIDNTQPDSKASAEPFSKNSPVEVDWTASDSGSGVSSTALWYKKESEGTWADSGLSAQSGIEGTFSFLPEGDGVYYFATRSTDNIGNEESAPSGSGDTESIFDTKAPDSQASSQSISQNSTISVEWTASDSGSGVSSTALWYKKESGGSWAKSELSAQSGTSGKFLFESTEGAGAYYFATVSIDNAGNKENEPSDNGDCTVTLEDEPAVSDDDPDKAEDDPDAQDNDPEKKDDNSGEQGNDPEKSDDNKELRDDDSGVSGEKSSEKSSSGCSLVIF